MKNGTLFTLSWWLMWVGALNWLLVGAFEWNLVTFLFGNVWILERLIYVLVGLAALYSLLGCKAMCKK